MTKCRKCGMKPETIGEEILAGFGAGDYHCNICYRPAKSERNFLNIPIGDDDDDETDGQETGGNATRGGGNDHEIEE